jgi:hypothetical protein
MFYAGTIVADHDGPFAGKGTGQTGARTSEGKILKSM